MPINNQYKISPVKKTSIEELIFTNTYKYNRYKAILINSINIVIFVAPVPDTALNKMDETENSKHATQMT